MQQFDLIIRGGTVVTPASTQLADIGIRDGKIVQIGDIDVDCEATRFINAEGKHVLPGIFHTHCHFRDPGHTYKEDFASGTRAAAAGGITFCIDQTNNDPHPTTLETFLMKRETVEKKAYVDFALYGGGLYPKTVADLAKAGAIMIKVFNTRHIKEVFPYISELGVVDHGILYELYEAVADTGLATAVHHDDSEWVKRMVLRDYIGKGKTDYTSFMDAYERGYMYGHGMVAGLAASLYYARVAKARLHVLHMGLMPVGAYELVRHAKFELGQNVTTELEMQSMLMTREQAAKVGPYNCLFGHSPAAAWESIKNGVADVLVAEHAPHTREDVEPGWEDMFSVPLGMTGVQEFVPMMLTQVNQGSMALGRFVELASENPAKLYGLFPQKGAIQVGSDADFTIVDMNKPGVLTAKDMLTKAGHTVWEGTSVTAQPIYTIVRGIVVMEDGRVVGKQGTGRFTPGIGGRTSS